MSWDATLRVPGVPWATRDWNYTHNTNRMINAALEDAGVVVDETWWKMLDGLTGTQGLDLLTTIRDQFDAEPARYRAMNPENGWGSFDDPEYGGIRRVIGEMIEASEVEALVIWDVDG